MSHIKVIIVLLRQPRKNDPNEMRSDPFWEFGSFGCTGCHSKNLLNLKNARRLEDSRLAFAQGGCKGFKLIYLTPAIEIIRHKDLCEAKWTPIQKPFRYDNAPLLIDNKGKTEFPLLRKFIENTNRSTWMGKFSSRFRSRFSELDEIYANEIIKKYDRKFAELDESELASSYEETLPYLPSIVDSDRNKTYELLLRKVKKCR